MSFSGITISYKSLQGSISSMYKGMSPFSLRKAEDITPEQRCGQAQLENLKWQQEVFHRIMYLVGLYKEGMVSEEEVGVFRTELLFTLIASPAEGEWRAITRDKLLFLQDLLYAKCISEEDYHISKRPLLLRLAAQGEEIDSQDLLLRGIPIPCAPDTVRTVSDAMQESCSKQETEWSVVDLNEDQNKLKSLRVMSTGDNIKEKPNLSLTPYKGGKPKFKHPSLFVPKPSDLWSSKHCYSARKPPNLPMQGGHKRLGIQNPSESFKENPYRQYVRLIDVHKRGATRAKVKKALNQLVLKLHQYYSNESASEDSYSSHFNDSDSDTGEEQSKPVKRSWGSNLLKSFKKTKSEEEMTELSLNEAASEEALSPSQLVSKPIGEGPNTKKIKKKILFDGAATDFFIDKVLGEKIKIELSGILTEMDTTKSISDFSDEQIEAIAIRLPVDKRELEKLFPKSWCDRYGDIVLDVVQREFKHHVEEMESLRRSAQERRNSAARRWSMQNQADKAKVRPHKRLPSDILNRCFTTEDENFDPHISPFSSSFKGEHCKSPFPKSPSTFSRTPYMDKSPSPLPFSPINNHDSPSSSPSLKRRPKVTFLT